MRHGDDDCALNDSSDETLGFRVMRRGAVVGWSRGYGETGSHGRGGDVVVAVEFRMARGLGRGVSGCSSLGDEVWES